MPIPSFCDGYYLPPGEHTCTLDEIEATFGSATECRRAVWKRFCALLDRCSQLQVQITTLLIDGSFVTGRPDPGDVDAVAYVTPAAILFALSQANEHDAAAIQMLFLPKTLPAPFSNAAEPIVRNLFGAHLIPARDLDELDNWSRFFRLRIKDPDPARDPVWVRKPSEKGILRVEIS
jgi:hypothetical protein